MKMDADEILRESEKKRDAYWDGLSDRTRTLCLGTLALIWGIFDQKKSADGLDVSRHSKIALLTIGLSAILVLVLDFGEYVFGFEYRRKLAGEEVRGDIDFRSWESRIRLLKIVLGALTLIALCIVLACVLSTTAFAQAEHGKLYLGTWCGGDKTQGKYTCLMVAAPEDEYLVKLAYQGRQGWLDCEELQFGNAELYAHCGRAWITASVPQNWSLQLKLQIGDWEDTRELTKVR